MPQSFSYPTVLALINTIFVLLFVSAAVTDLWKRKIYNFQTYPAIVCGLLLWTVNSGWHGLGLSLAGFCTGMAILFLFYLLGGVGAGDVKLLGAIGALKGSSFVLWVMFYTGLIGGIMAFAVIIWKGRVRQTFVNIFTLLRHPVKGLAGGEKDPLYLPYGLAISLGSFWAFLVL
jgi:prepilin peptidase CpaA